jgi:hypothetical protein
MKPKVIAAAIASCILVLAGYFILSLAWSYQTGNDIGSSPAIGTAVAPSLGAAETFAVLGAQAVTNTGGTVITGDFGICPKDLSSVTGFTFSTSPGPGIVNGAKYFAADAQPAQDAVTTAYDDLVSQTCTATIISSEDLGGRTLAPGVYCSDSSMKLGFLGSLTLTLDAQGDPNAVWVFKMPDSTLTTAPGSSVRLINGGQDCNVFWQVGSSATLDTTTTFVGNILALTSITINNGANVSGRALARNGAVTLDTNNVAVCALLATPTPTPTGPTPTPTPTGPTPTPTETPGGPTRTPTATPTPTPCFCDRVRLGLSPDVVRPGDKIVVSACLPLVGGVPGNPIDVYLLFRTPGGTIYSILPDNVIVKGLIPYYSGEYKQDIWCGTLYTHTACRSFGKYAVVLGMMPAGVPPSRRDVIDYDLGTVRVVP